MLRLVGIVMAIILGLVMVINASCMLVSPRSWFRLPEWLQTRGTLTEEKYVSGWGAVQVRLTGAVLLAVVAWVIYDMFFNHR